VRRGAGRAPSAAAGARGRMGRLGWGGRTALALLALGGALGAATARDGGRWSVAGGVMTRQYTGLADIWRPSVVCFDGLFLSVWGVYFGCFATGS